MEVLYRHRDEAEIVTDATIISSKTHKKHPHVQGQNKMNCETEWHDAMSSMNEVSTVSYWNGRAKDYNDFIQTSRFSYGEKIVEILLHSGFLQYNMRIFEIAGGVGALTLPLCKNVMSVTTVEPARKMAEKLINNADEQGINNVKILLQTGQEAAENQDVPVHDAAIMCHASWQFPNIRWLVEFMERIGSGRVCLADSIPDTNRSKKEFYSDLGISHHSFDRFHGLYKVLCDIDRKPDIQLFPFTMRRSSESARAMITQVLSKYRQPETADHKKIEAFVDKYSVSGIYEEEVSMGVLWWHTIPPTE
jgi:precorrin-6B methylase 2